MNRSTIKKGLKVGLETTWSLGKVIFPVTLLVTILQYTPILPWVIELVTPVMKIFGLSGEAAIPLVLGNFLNLYAGIGAILTLEMTVKEVFIIAVMLSFSHNIFVESSIALKVGVKLWVAFVVRFALAGISAMIINLLWKGGGEIAKYGLVQATNEEATGYLNIFMLGLEKAALGIFQIAMIVIPLMIAIQILKDLQWLNVFSKWMKPMTRMLGMKENTSLSLAAGLLFGLTFGAGVIIQAVKEDGVSKKDATLTFIFLAACHAVVEDTLVFVPLGIPVLALLGIRLVMAIILTMTIAFIWKRAELAKLKEATYEYRA